MGQASASVISSTVPFTDGGKEGKPNRTWFQLMSKLSTLVGAIATQATSADLSITNNTTLQDVPPLAVNMAANEAWLATYTLDVGAALATTGLKIAVTAPAGIADINILVGIAPDKITAGNVMSGRTTSAGTAIAFAAAGFAAVGGAAVTVTVVVLNGATAGPLQLQVAQNTNSATALTIRQGSQMIANRIQ